MKQVEEQLAKAGELRAAVEEAFGRLLNVVEALSSDKQALADEVERLRKQLEQKKKAKTTADVNNGDAQESNSDGLEEPESHPRTAVTIPARIIIDFREWRINTQNPLSVRHRVTRGPYNLSIAHS